MPAFCCFRGALRRRDIGGAGWSSPVARQAHNLKVVGSNPTPATNLICKASSVDPAGGFFVSEQAHSSRIDSNRVLKAALRDAALQC